MAKKISVLNSELEKTQLFAIRQSLVIDALYTAAQALLIDSAAHINVPVSECVAGPLGRVREALALADKLRDNLKG